VKTLTAADLLTLEAYARERPAFRAEILAHKRHRQFAVGPEMTWCFEDRRTVQYQVQEMLRIERIFEPGGIADELAAYNPLIPDGANLKATLLIEIPDPVRRRERLAQLRGVEDVCYLQVDGFDRNFAIADEDLTRENDEKTSSVHFLRFEFEPAPIAALRAGAPLAAGVDHPAARHHVASLPDDVRRALVADFA
jgi:hypothetical protein